MLAEVQLTVDRQQVITTDNPIMGAADRQRSADDSAQIGG